MAALQVELVGLGQVCVVALHVQAAGAAVAATAASAATTTAAAAQEAGHSAALPGVAHRVAEHLVDLLLRWHPPVWVGGTVHPDELWERKGGTVWAGGVREREGNQGACVFKTWRICQ